MLGEFGQLLLSMAFVACVVQVLTAAFGIYTQKTSYIQSSMWALYVHMLALIMGFGVLMAAFLYADLSLKVVVENSHALVPVLYKISGTWGNHEGSILMWSCMTAFSAALLLFRIRENLLLSGYFSLLLGCFALMLLGFMVFTSNPFARLPSPALFGAELNPILQDPFLAIHPPMLYAGYVFIGIACTFIFAMILSLEMTAKQWNILHKTLLLAWVFLTIGILLGSYWAYRELGWGGFWFWDPVENVSLMPWLIATAVLHAGNADKRHQQHQLWIASLLLVAFLLCIIGTFLVRSGLLVSPHTFASDPSRGVFLLLIFAVIAFASLVVLFRFGRQIKIEVPLYFLSRENAMFMGSMILVSICAGVFVGTLYPLFVEIFWQRVIAVGHPYYNFVFIPMGLFAVFLAGLAPYLMWQQNETSLVLKRIILPFLCSLCVVCVVLYILGVSYLYASVALGIVVWLFWSMVELAVRLFMQQGMRGLTYVASMVTAHIGLGVVTISIVGMTIFDDLATANVEIGQTIAFGDEKIILEGISEEVIDNYYEIKARIRLLKKSGEEHILMPTRRIYYISGVETAEPYLQMEWWQDYQAILGDELPDGRVALRLYRKPLALWLWVGGLMMAFGGCLGMIRKKYAK